MIRHPHFTILSQAVYHDLLPLLLGDVIYCTPMVSRSGCFRHVRARSSPIVLALHLPSRQVTTETLDGPPPDIAPNALSGSNNSVLTREIVGELPRQNHHLPGLWKRLCLDRGRTGILPESWIRARASPLPRLPERTQERAQSCQLQQRKRECRAAATAPDVSGGVRRVWQADGGSFPAN